MSGPGPETDDFVVVAEFAVRPDRLDAFLPAARDDARDSGAKEAGCRQFDIAVEPGDPVGVVFYEVYADRIAFDAHLETPHAARFRETLSLVESEMPPRFLHRASLKGAAS